MFYQLLNVAGPQILIRAPKFSNGTGPTGPQLDEPYSDICINMCSSHKLFFFSYSFCVSGG